MNVTQQPGGVVTATHTDLTEEMALLALRLQPSGTPFLEVPRKLLKQLLLTLQFGQTEEKAMLDFVRQMAKYVDDIDINDVCLTVTYSDKDTNGTTQLKIIADPDPMDQVTLEFEHRFLSTCPAVDSPGH